MAQEVAIGLKAETRRSETERDSEFRGSVLLVETTKQPKTQRHFFFRL